MMEQNTCGILIKQIHSELEKNANNALRQDDITMAQISVLIILSQAENNQLEQKQVEQSLHIAQSTAAGIVKRLEQKGYIESLTSIQDKRMKMIRITAAGMECCQKAEVNMQKTESQLMAALTEIEYSILISLLQKIRNSF